EKDPVLARGLREQRHRGAELAKIGIAENLLDGAALHLVDDPRAFPQPGAEHRVAQIRLGLRQRSDRIALRHLAESDAPDLLQDNPHPVGALEAGAQLRDTVLEHGLLGIHETLQVERITHHLPVLTRVHTRVRMRMYCSLLARSGMSRAASSPW